MKYIIISKDVALRIGINLVGHYVLNNKIVVNQNEILLNNNLDGTLEERVSAIKGKLYTAAYTQRLIKKEGYELQCAK
ncbi:MAG: hypothetical protein PHU69_12180 [Fermentimonas sp.]|nr:hypothetical protein [Fermentimonas sp.]